MNLSQFLVQSILCVQSLSILISRIITDGEFNTVLLVYDSNSLEDRLLSGIIQQLPVDVQFEIKNVAETETSFGISKWKILTDKTLQLIFVDKIHLKQDFGKFQQELDLEKHHDEILYRLYVLLVSNESDSSQYESLHSISKYNSEMSSMLAIHDTTFDKTEIFLFPNKTNKTTTKDRPIYIHYGYQNITGNAFDLTLNYWYRNIRINSPCTRDYIRNEQSNISIEVNPDKSGYMIACLTTMHNEFKELFYKIIVQDNIRIMSNKTVVTIEKRLWEVVKNEKPTIYEDIMPKYKEANLTDL